MKVTDDNKTFRFTLNTTLFSAVLTTGEFYMRGDGTADDLAKNITDAMATASSGTFTRDVLFDYNADQVSTKLSIDAGSDTWAPRHDDGSNTFPSKWTGYSDTAPSEASEQVSVESQVNCWVPTRPGREVESEEQLGEVNTYLDGSYSLWTRGPLRKFISIEWGDIHQRRAGRRDNTDPNCSWQSFWAEARKRPWELWRVELDANGQFDFTGSTNREFIGVKRATREQLRGVNPIRPNEKVPFYNITL